MSATVLVVDDEPGVNELICDALHLSGYRTITAPHGLEALRILRDSQVDLVVLDVNMPQADGFEVLRRMRDNGDRTPVIVLTARQDREDTRTGFELGADDFVHKPFGIEELTLRVRAVLRRAQPPAEVDNGVVTVGAVTLDRDRHRVTRSGVEVSLSATEFRLLAVLMENVDRVLSKDVLLARVWGLEGELETTVVETYVSYLRRKLDTDLSLRTVRGVGYQLLRPEST